MNRIIMNFISYMAWKAQENVYVSTYVIVLLRCFNQLLHSKRASIVGKFASIWQYLTVMYYKEKEKIPPLRAAS